MWRLYIHAQRKTKELSTQLLEQVGPSSRPRLLEWFVGRTAMKTADIWKEFKCFDTCTFFYGCVSFSLCSTHLGLGTWTLLPPKSDALAGKIKGRQRKRTNVKSQAHKSWFLYTPAPLVARLVVPLSASFQSTGGNFRGVYSSSIMNPGCTVVQGPHPGSPPLFQFQGHQSPKAPCRLIPHII